MTVTHPNASTVLVAIDISKHRHEVLIGVPGKKRRRRRRPPSVIISISDISMCLGICRSLLGQAKVSGRNGGQFTQFESRERLSPAFVAYSA